MDPKENMIYCKRCKAPIGYIVNGELWLVGNVVLTEAHGVCAHCGYGFHYAINIKLLQKIVKSPCYNTKIAELLKGSRD